MKLDFLHQVVGKTRTGKPIICALNSQDVIETISYFQDSHFTTEDFFDAYAAFEYLSIRSTRRSEAIARLYSEHSLALKPMISHADYERIKIAARIVTVFDLRAFGRRLISIEFRDD